MYRMTAVVLFGSEYCLVGFRETFFCFGMDIGEAGRAFEVRLQEHRQEVSQRDVRAYTQSTSKSAATEQNKSAITDHAVTLNHVIDCDQAKMID